MKSKDHATHLDKRHVQDLDPCAFVPVAPPGTEEPSPVVFRITSTSRFGSRAYITNVPLRRRQDLHLDPRVPPAPSRLPHLAPSHTAGVHRSGNDIRVVRVRSAAPHAWVSGACAWQREGWNIQRCACHCTISGERQGAERMHERTKVDRWCCTYARSRRRRCVRVVGASSWEVRTPVYVRVRVLVLMLMLVLVRVSVRTRVGMSVVVTMRMWTHSRAWRGWWRGCPYVSWVSRVMIVRMLMLMRVGVRVRVWSVFIRRWMRVMDIRISEWRPLYLRQYNSSASVP